MINSTERKDKQTSEPKTSYAWHTTRHRGFISRLQTQARRNVQVAVRVTADLMIDDNGGNSTMALEKARKLVKDPTTSAYDRGFLGNVIGVLKKNKK